MEALIVLCMNSIFHEVQNLSRPIIWSAIRLFAAAPTKYYLGSSCHVDTSGIKRATATLRVHQPQSRSRRVVGGCRKAWRGLPRNISRESSLLSTVHHHYRRNFWTRTELSERIVGRRVAMFLALPAPLRLQFV